MSVPPAEPADGAAGARPVLDVCVRGKQQVDRRELAVRARERQRGRAVCTRLLNLPVSEMGQQMLEDIRVTTFRRHVQRSGARIRMAPSSSPTGSTTSRSARLPFS